MPKVSVVLPVYNSSKYLSESISSILNQTYDDFEFLIIDDGSTDNSGDIVNTFKDKRILFYQNEQNLGLVTTLNKAIDLVDSEYILRLDADDIAIKNRIEKQIAFMDSDTDLVASGGYASIMSFDGKRLNKTWTYPLDDPRVKARLFWGNSIIHPTSIIRNSVIKDNEIKYSQNYPHAEDYHLWWQLVDKGKLANLPKVLINYRKHDNQITNKFKQEQQSSSGKIVIDYLADKGLIFNTEEKEIYSRIQQFNYHFSKSELFRIQSILERILIFVYDFFPSIRKAINVLLSKKWFEVCYHCKHSDSLEIFFSSKLSQYYQPKRSEMIKHKLKSFLSR